MMENTLVKKVYDNALVGNGRIGKLAPDWKSYQIFLAMYAVYSSFQDNRFLGEECLCNIYSA